MATTARKTTTAKMSAEQSAYLEATERVMILHAAKKEAMDATGLPLETEADIDAYTEAEMAIHERLGLNAAYDAQREARIALFAWTHECVKTLPAYGATRDQIEEMFAKVDRHPHLMERLVTTCMQLRA